MSNIVFYYPVHNYNFFILFFKEEKEEKRTTNFYKMRNPKTNIHQYSVGTSGSSSFLHISLFLLVIVVTEMSLRAQSASEVLWAGVTEVFDRWTSKTSSTPSDYPTPGRATCSNSFPRLRIDVGLCQRCPSATDACSVVYMWYIISEILIDK